jgi:hypothetical protein
MDIQAHDENSLTNLLFSELHRHNKLQGFLDAIIWLGGATFQLDSRDGSLHQQVNLSEFGRPDAMIVLPYAAGGCHVVIVESKLTTYLKACAHNLPHRRFNNCINTKLNNQLTLRYRAMRALRTLATDGYLTEQEHAPESPYSADQVRRCKKCKTLRFLRRLPADVTFSLVALTSDSRPPYTEIGPTHHFFPLFFDEASGRAEDDFPRLGCISWHRCNDLFADVANHYSPSYAGLFHSLPQAGGDTATAPAGTVDDRRRQIVRFRGELCYFSHTKPGSYRLHRWTGSAFELIDEASSDVDKEASLRPLLRPVCPAPRTRRDGHDAEWRDHFDRLARTGSM